MKRIIKPNTVSKDDVKEFLTNRFKLDTFLFDKQLAFIKDPEPFKVAVCSRRAGKTVACAAHLMEVAYTNPGTMSIYITLSMKNAERIIWKQLKEINTQFKLGAKPKDKDLVMEFPNGSSIHLCGANNVTEIENFRGVPLKLVYIDECQSFKQYIKDLVDDILSPALMDYAGTLSLIGTPGPVPVGFFYDCYKSQAWSKHSWTFWDNPHIADKSGKTHKELLERELKRRGVDVNNPSIQREWFGQWVLDSDSLILHYDQNKNSFNELPKQKYTYILGIDIGYEDSDALAVLGWSDTDPTTYLVEEMVTPKQGITGLVRQIQELQSRYEISKMVMDMGGLGKKIGEEIIQRYQLPVEAAEKTRKMENYELLDDSLRTGRFKARSNSQFAHDSYLVEIDRDKSTPDRIVVSSRYHSDIIDAVLYAFKLSPSYAYQKPKETYKYGSKEWAKQQEEEMFQHELDKAMQEAEYQKRMNGDWG